MDTASAITRGRLKDFFLDRLMTLLGRLGLDIEIVVAADRTQERAPRLVVRNIERDQAVSR